MFDFLGYAFKGRIDWFSLNGDFFLPMDCFEQTTLNQLVHFGSIVHGSRSGMRYGIELQSTHAPQPHSLKMRFQTMVKLEDGTLVSRRIAVIGCREDGDALSVLVKALSKQLSRICHAARRSRSSSPHATGR